MTRNAFLRGAIRGAPIATSVLPFSLVAAVSATDAGMSSLETVGLSVVVFAGAAQLAALELARADAPALFIIGAAVVVNLRFALYSASLSRHVRNLPTRTRAAMAYLLTDQAYALSIDNYESDAPADGLWFYFGAAASLWFAWQLGTLAGIAVGAGVPPELSLDFAVALAFIALAVPALSSMPALAAAVTSVAVYIVAAGLPYGVGLLPAAGAGMLAGSVAERFAR